MLIINLKRGGTTMTVFNPDDSQATTNGRTVRRVGKMRIIQEGGNKPVITIDDEGTHIYPAGTKIVQDGSRIRIIHKDNVNNSEIAVTNTTTVNGVKQTRQEQQAINEAEYQRERNKKILQKLNADERKTDVKGAETGLAATGISYIGLGIEKATKKIGNATTNSAIRKGAKVTGIAGKSAKVLGQLEGAWDDAKQTARAIGRGDVGDALFNGYQTVSGLGTAVGYTDLLRNIPGWGKWIDLALDVNGYISDGVGAIVDGATLIDASKEVAKNTGKDVIDNIADPDMIKTKQKELDIQESLRKRGENLTGIDKFAWDAAVNSMYNPY